MSEFTREQFTIDGWECVALAAGPTDGPLVVAVHGFPDTAHTFARLLPVLADGGFRVVAPFTRGIPPSGGAPDGDYGVPRLAADLAGLVRACGRSRAHLVGHDWGAVAGYAAAALHPEVVDRLVVAAVPPPSTFLRHMTLRQAWRSAYMVAFQVRALPEAVLRRSGGAVIERLWRRWSPGWTPDRTALDEARRALCAPGALEAALAYYRAIPDALAGPAAVRRAVLGPVHAPTLLVGGERDGCIGIDLMEAGMADLRGEARFLRLNGGHFAHLEDADVFNAAVLSFLAPGGGSVRDHAPR